MSTEEALPEHVARNRAHWDAMAGDWVSGGERSWAQDEPLIEIQAPAGATTSYEYTSPEWSRRWPSEEVWKARKVR